MRAEPHGWVIVPPLARDAGAILAPPRLTPGACARLPLARAAGVRGVPVLLVVPNAAGRLLLARALHALAGREGPLVAARGRRPQLDRVPRGATVYVDLAALAPETAVVLEAMLDDRAVWLLGALEPGVTPPPALATRVGGVVLELPRLAERTADLPALAAAVLSRYGASIAPSAVARLAAHSWPGDLVELETVLARAMLVAGERPIEADDLALDVTPVAPSPPAGPSAAEADAELEFLMAELAHELRNPMVTIKTFARHLPALLEDAELRERFDQLAQDAIERMDGLLENVLAFARLGPPHTESIEVGKLLERVVADVEPDLNGRVMRVRQAVPGARCAVDPVQISYALRNLFAGVVREVPAREEVALDTTANGVVTLRFAAGAETADRLRRLAAPGDATSLADPTLLPLSFRLARAVLERNGGALSVVPEGGDATSVVIRLPTAPAEEGS
jgi:signal transduction histidine kinase